MLDMRLLLLCLLTACGSPSSEDIRDEGQRHVLLLTNELRTIKSREQLLEAQERLKVHFDALVDLMVDASEAHLRKPELEDDQRNIELQAQLQRVCRITGGLEILEKCQEAALNRLHLSTSSKH
jgi:hypothetical protein